ncbi:hypothetical protein CE91St41_09180 [Oscillospiraceae bacterium]|nr:hypothetical protein CE91St40_28350 [Oscillospiraceae bacterium]BDF74029.1 hypothetical protein CE91St41_09180 [Oscillospiraceae bacterium]
MNKDLPQYEENLTYDFEETDPRFCVEFLTPCPKLSPNSPVYFDGFSWNECGLVFKYIDGDNSNPRSFELKVVFPCTFKSMRVFAMTAHQENKLWVLQNHSAAAHLPNHIFHFYRCRYSNYYNWCMQQGFFRETDGFYHYVIAAVDTWIDVFSADYPNVFCRCFGQNLSDAELEAGHIFDAFYKSNLNESDRTPSVSD